MTEESFLDDIRSGNFVNVISYIPKCPDINAFITVFGNGQRTPLGWACYYDQPTIVKVLIHHKADVNRVFEDRSPLRDAAVIHSNPAIVLDLVTAGANVSEAKGQENRTVLEEAALKKNFEIIRILVDKVADFSKHKKFIKILFDTSNTAILNYLHEKGLDINKKYDDIGSPLVYCVGTSNYDMVSWLINRGGKLAIPSAFIRAVEVGRLSIIEKLNDRGADVNLHYKNGTSPLLLSLQLNRQDVARYLLEAGANPNFEDKDGNRPLILAIQKNQPEIVKMLIERDVEIDIKDQEGNTPLALALKLKQGENTKLLMIENTEGLVQKKNLFFLFQFIEQKCVDNVRTLLEEKKMNLNGFDDSGWTPLTKSVDLGLVEVARMLIEKGAQIDKADKNGKTPLKIAVAKFNFELIDLLVRHRCNTETCKEDMKKLADENEDFSYYLQSVIKF